MVDVAHNHDDGCAGTQILFLVGGVVDQTLLHRNDDFLLRLAAELHGDERRGVVVDDLGHGGEDAQLHELLDNLGRGLLHAHGQIPHTDLVRDLHLQRLLLGNLKLQAVHLVALFLAALGGARLGAVGALLLGFAVDLLLVAAAHVRVVGLRAGHIFKLLVVLFDVDRGAASGIDNALFRNLARGMRFVGLLLRLRRRRGGFGLCRGRLLGRFLYGLLLRGGLFLRLNLGFGLFLRFRRRGRLCRRLENLLQAFGLVVLCHILKDHIQFRGLQNLHVVFRRCYIICKNLRDHL